MDDVHRSSRKRTIVIGAACFALASIAVRADSLPPNAVPPGRIEAIADATDTGRTVSVNGSGELSARDQGARDRLDQVNSQLAQGLAVDVRGQVEVANFPPTQAVTGTVVVANLPAQQTVSGTVSVSNFPATQPVSGSVTVANLPSTQDVNIVGGGLELDDTSVAIAAGSFHLAMDGVSEEEFLQPHVQPCEPGDCPPGFHTSRFLQLFSHTMRRITLVSLNTDRDVHLTCRRHGTTLWTIATSSNVTHEFVHPLEVDECYLMCNTLEPRIGTTELSCLGNVAIAGITGSTGGGGFVSQP